MCGFKTNNLSSTFNDQIEIANESESFSARKLLEIDIYTQEYEYSQGFETRIKQLSQTNDYAGLEETLLADETVDSQRRLLGLQFLKKDFVAAQAVLDNLPEETIDDGLFKEIQYINLDFLSTEEVFELSAQQEDFLYQTALEHHPSSSYARGLLMLLKGENFLVSEDLATDSQQSIAPNVIPNINNLELAELTIFPNPTQQEVMIQLPKEFIISSNTNLRIINANGVLVQSLKLEEGDQQIKINISNYPNGLYFTGIWQEETLTSFKRLIVSK